MAQGSILGLECSAFSQCGGWPHRGGFVSVGDGSEVGGIAD